MATATATDTRQILIQSLIRDRIPAQYRCGFPAYRALTPQHRAIKRCAKQWADGFTPFTTRGLYMFGTPGSGKSFLGCSILRRVIERGFFNAYYENTAKLAQEIRESWDLHHAGPSEREIMDSLLEADLVFLDDIGADPCGEWFQDRLYVIINEFEMAQKPLIMATNCTSVELRKHWPKNGARILSRMEGMADSVGAFPDQDFRGTPAQ